MGIYTMDYVLDFILNKSPATELSIVFGLAHAMLDKLNNDDDCDGIERMYLDPDDDYKDVWIKARKLKKYYESHLDDDDKWHQEIDKLWSAFENFCEEKL